MKKYQKSYIYIDWANLHQWSKSWWWIDYQRFYHWLKDKYKAQVVYLFVWYVIWNEPLYSQLSKIWYTLIFKETLEIEGKVKWNCDAELVVQAVTNRYEWDKNSVVLVTGDGDFACLVDFFVARKTKVVILAPHRSYCSFLLKKRNIPIVFLQEIAQKIIKNPQ